MPWVALFMAMVALAIWIAGAPRRRRIREHNQKEVEATLQTGLPTSTTAVGQKAREVVSAASRQLDAPPPIHGTARWATKADLGLLLHADHWHAVSHGIHDLYLGSLLEDGGFGGDGDRETGTPVVARYPGHLLTVAGTGQGKSATQIIANLMIYKGSVVVLDPKGELFDATAEARRRFGKVFRLAPLAKAGEPVSNRYNPLEELDDEREPGRELANRARRLAEMLIVRQGAKGASEATFFENEAINLLTAVIMFVVERTEKPEHRDARTLESVRDVCTLPILAGRKERVLEEYLEDEFIRMATTSRFDYVRRQGRLFQGYDVKLLSSILSELNSNLAFWDGHPGFAEVTSECEFKFADLEKETVTVYLSIPFKDMPTSYRFLRAMVGMAFAAMEEKREATRASVLFILDEFAALKDMEFMRDAVAQMRSSGAWFWIFVQDVAQLEGVYGRWADVFLSQTDHQVFFGGTIDSHTRRHVSTMLGVTTFPYRTPNVSWSHSVGVNDGTSHNPSQSGSGVNYGRSIGQSVNIADPVMLAPRPLLSPFEVGTFLAARPGERHASTAVLLSKQSGGYPVKLRRQHWRALPLDGVQEVQRIAGE